MKNKEILKEIAQYLNTSHLFDFRTESLSKLIHQEGLSVESIDRYFYYVPGIWRNYYKLLGRTLMRSEIPKKNLFTILILTVCIGIINLRFLFNSDPMMKIEIDSPWFGFGDTIRTLAAKK